MVLVILGLLLKNGLNLSSSNVQVLETPTDIETQIAIDIGGSVKNPGLYYLPTNSRVEDVLQKAGGLSDDASTSWLDKNLNRAAKLIDGQKIFIPKGQASLIPFQQSNVSSATNLGSNDNVAQSDNEPVGGLININTSSLSRLEELPGIGQIYGQKIIENRPYSDVNDLVSKKILPVSTFNKIKDKIKV